MSQSIKIVHVVHSLNVGGLENGLVNLLNHLDEQFSHTILCLSKAGPMAQRIKNREVAIIEMGLPTDRFRFPLVSLARLFRQISPDIVHTRGWSSIDAISAARIACVPHVIHAEHGWEATDPEGQSAKRKLVRKCLSPLVDRFVTVSEDLKRWLTGTVGIAERKVVRIHNGVDTQKFAPLWDAQSAMCIGHRAESGEQKEMPGDGRRETEFGSQSLVVGHRSSAIFSLRRTLRLPDDAVVIGTVGRLDPVKDHKTLLQAFAQLARRNPSVRLVIAGEGPMRGDMETQIRELKIGDQVQMLGERQDVSEVLKAFDVFTLTSIAEGISNTILEAMASGLPIVATRVGGNPELVEHGASGHLIPAQNVSALESALLAYVTSPDLRGSHGAAARQKAVDEFSLERMAEQYAELYFSVMVKPVRRPEGSGLRTDS